MIKNWYDNLSSTEHAEIAENFVDHFLYPEVSATNISDDQAANYPQMLLREITLEQVNAITSIFSLSQFKTIMMQHFDAAKFPSEEQIEHLFVEVEKEELAPRKSKNSAVSLLDTSSLTEGKIAEQKFDERTEVTQILLDNGMQVLLKPLQTQKGRVQIYVYSNKGLLDVPAEYMPLARKLNLISSCSGYGQLSAVQIQTIAAKEGFSVINPIIDNNDSSFGVACSSEALELQLQFVHLAIAQPKCDLQQFHRIINDVKQQILQIKSAQKEISLAEENTKELYCDHPAFYAWERLNFDDVQSDDVVPFYRALLGDPQELQISIIGDFDVSSAPALLQKYLGSIPVLSAEEKSILKKSSVSMFSGESQHITMYRQHIENQTNETVVNFVPDFSIAEERVSIKKGMQIVWLKQILENGLTCALRENDEKHGLYSYSVGMNETIDLQTSFKGKGFKVGFSAHPDQIEKTIATIVEVIQELQQQGPSPQMLSEIRANILRNQPKQLEDSDYWYSLLISSFINHEPIDSILDIPKWAEEALQVEPMRKLAQEWLNTDCMLRLTLLPKPQLEEIL